MTLHQLEIFATLAKLGSFKQTSEKLHIARSGVSHLIQNLERELEVELFERLGNKYHLTSAGEELLRHAEEMLAKVEEVKEEIDEIKGLKKGWLRIGSTVLAATSFLPIVVQRFEKDFPEIKVVPRVDRSEDLVTNLLDGELDLALIGFAPHSPLLVVQPYCQEEIVFIAAPNHPLAKRRSVPLELIAKEPLITPRRGIYTRSMVEERFAERGLHFVPWLEIGAQFSARDAIKSAVSGGLGIGFVAKSHVVVDVEAGRIKILRVPKLDLKRTMYVAVHKKRHSSSLVQAFIEFLRHYYKAQK